MTSISSAGVPCRRLALTRDDGPTLQITEWGSQTPRVTMVLTHGLALSHESWEDVAQLVIAADPTIRVVTYDHRGHGDSESAPASLEILADDLATILSETVPTGPVVLGGHSMGGMTLMALAERHSEVLGPRILGVALVSTGAGDILGNMLRSKFWRRLIMLGLEALPYIRIPSRPLFLMRQSTRGILFGARPRRHDMNRAVLQLAKSNSRNVAELTRSILSHKRYGVLGRFSCRVVVLVGSRDRLTPVHHSRALRHRIPGSHLVIFEKAGHYLPYERSGEVAVHLLGLTREARIREATVA
ncbi:alpha/beta hydrolase [Nocardia cyriacigeorgica]|jgi:pimeloyl-ACP methyl ester carboxylesterase|uniref:Putative Alpha/beta hydrolase n=1 Tax=Nocardia cyriacigeorgica (strain GUH-2) TaxID=1127134 RepID=H6R8W9_NOCCG|nr:alpha/beta hydrolase [Nocardia cyriacigeorgica]BDT85919.1 alpha/beta hydrolase [Nocardia cyriacigeorgica]CCF62343.1 putative Alpha/beta hydrolase [Nocardia cyriacigeorgica GUH-2]